MDIVDYHQRDAARQPVQCVGPIKELLDYSAVVCSLALQFGTPVETIRPALLRDAHGTASSPLGVALDLIAGDVP